MIALDGRMRLIENRRIPDGTVTLVGSGRSRAIVVNIGE